MLKAFAVKGVALLTGLAAKGLRCVSLGDAGPALRAHAGRG